MSKVIIFFGISFLLILNLSVVNVSASVPPIDVTGSIDGAPYRIVVPTNWNKTLLVYAHGYRDKADHQGEVDNRAADIAPTPELAAVLLGQGYALAGSAYRENGWAVEEGIRDLKNLTMYFKRNVAKPRANILWAFSMGTVITFKSMERFDDIYDGALCACGVGAGATQSWDSAGDLALAYKTVFGTPETWGTPGDVRDDIDFETEVQPKLFGEVSSPANFPKFEFLRLVTGTPGRGLNPPAPPAFYPGWIFTDMFFATEARSELERRAGGAITQNLDRDYNLTVGEKAYLVALGVPSAAIDGWLAAMNGQRNISAPNSSRRYVRRNANYSGEIENPVLTIHTQFDPLVTVSQEFEYAQTVMNAGNSRKLFQTYTNGNGHCNFTGPQLITAVNAINSWVRNRTKPTAATFPAAIGFLPDFVPPPMNQP
jgi:pimeloyl-ACP methyl ester carboxylesterase